MSQRRIQLLPKYCTKPGGGSDRPDRDKTSQSWFVSTKKSSLGRPKPKTGKPAKRVAPQRKPTYKPPKVNKSSKVKRASTETETVRAAPARAKRKKAAFLRDSLKDRPKENGAPETTPERVASIRDRIRARAQGEGKVATGSALPLRNKGKVKSKEKSAPTLGTVVPAPEKTLEPVVSTSRAAGEALKDVLRKAHKHRSNGEYSQAEPHFRKALELLEALFPPDHERLAQGLDHYAGVLLRLDRVEESVYYRRRSKFIRGKGESPGPVAPMPHPAVQVPPVEPSKALPPTVPAVPLPHGGPTLNPPETLPHASPVAPLERGVTLADLLHVKSSILRLEEFMRWDSLGEGWASRREGWVEEVCSASAVNALCQLVAEFESHLLWEVSEAGWESARDDWHAGFIDATEMSSLVEALILLEDHVCFRAFLDGWVGERVHWGRMVQWSDSD